MILSMILLASAYLLYLVTVPGYKQTFLNETKSVPMVGIPEMFGETSDVYYNTMIIKQFCSDACPCKLDYFNQLSEVGDDKLRHYKRAINLTPEERTAYRDPTTKYEPDTVWPLIFSKSQGYQTFEECYKLIKDYRLE